MRRLSKGNLQWLEFDLLADIPHLKHALFLRHGGHSKDPYDSLNTSYSVGDREEDVNANFQIIQDHFQENVEIPCHLYWGAQCHKNGIAFIDHHSQHRQLDTDALVTDTPGKVLMIRHADCQAAIFYDPVNKAIANVHAGWRGSVINIYADTISFMQKQFGTKPANLIVCISPSLGPEDAEFIHYAHELPKEFWSFQAKPTYFDFWAISEHQLKQSGVLPHHIEIARISTLSNPEDYFSYRRKKISGRHAACVTLV